MILLLLLFAQAASLPTTSPVTWMVPEAFHLELGMSRSKASTTLERFGWHPVAGKADNHLVVEYSENRTVTLAFEGDRLESIRFELVDFAPAVTRAFAAEEAFLRAKLGKPKRPQPRILIYDKKTPNIFVVLSTDQETEMGKQGLGFLAVRYFEPPR